MAPQEANLGTTLILSFQPPEALRKCKYLWGFSPPGSAIFLQQPSIRHFVLELFWKGRDGGEGMGWGWGSGLQWEMI